MRDLDEKRKSMTQEEFIKELQNKIKDLETQLEEYRTQKIISNQAIMNSWMKESIEVMFAEVMKLKDGVNQIMEFLEESSEESEPEIQKPTPKKIVREEVPEIQPKKKHFWSKAKKLGDDVKRFGDDIEEGMNEIP